MYSQGLVVGKFYPPHRGHKYLIDTAISQCREVTVLICTKERELIPGALRAKWLQEIHPDITVLQIAEPMPADDDSEGWARYTVEILGFVPDAVFTSEDYGEPYARFMGCRHVSVDKARVTVPISATKVRGDPAKYAEFLEPCVRAYFARRICVLGAESTGTTTLARDLAEHYKSSWVPEYGRMYSEGKMTSGEAWQSAEFLAIAQAQIALEDSLAKSVNGVLICDTDAFATSLWHERYMGSRSAEVEALADTRHYELYILTGDEIPFVQDGLRDGEHIRHEMHDRFVERLEETGRGYILVRGSKEERLEQAVAAIDALTR